MYTDTMEKITDHLFALADKFSDTCVICDEPWSMHDDDSFDPTPENFTYDGPRDTLDLYGIERFELGE